MNELTNIWGLQSIYQTRSRMNEDCNISLKAATHTVDAIAFGLKSYRTTQNDLTQLLLQKGVNFRIITMNPDSPFVTQREIEEGKAPGEIRRTIEQLIEWANELNSQGHKGTITIKGYSCMTLDFYWRIDDEIYIGPYWYGLDSQQTISYRYKNGIGFIMYSEYFEKLWNDSDLMVLLTK